MKTKNAVLTVAAMIVASVFTFAATPSKVAVVNQNSSGVFKVIYEGPTGGKVTLKIYDSRNNEIFSETNRGLSKFMRPLNFTGLEEGEYAIEVTDENGKQIQKVNYTIAKKSSSVQKAVAENKVSAKAVHISKLHEEGKYLLSVATQGNGKINVLIYDGNGNLIYDENRSINGNFGLVYNLKQVEGQPTFQVIDADSKKVIK